MTLRFKGKWLCTKTVLKRRFQVLSLHLLFLCLPPFSAMLLAYPPLALLPCHVNDLQKVTEAESVEAELATGISFLPSSLVLTI